MRKKNQEISRREFIKISGASSTLITAGVLTLKSCTGEVEEDNLETLFRIFSDPGAEAKPFFRWWWNGNNLTREEITRELEVMKAAGAGGVEINPIAMPEQVDDAGPGLIWLSDEWCEMVLHTVDECKRLELVADLIVGTGWPFGGEFIESGETLQGLTFETISITGPGQQNIQLNIPTGENERIRKIILIPEQITDIETAEILTDAVKDDGQLSFNIDEGHYTLMIIRWRNKFRTVFQGAPGGAGNVLDHFNGHAVRKYLSNMSDHLKPYLNENIGGGIRSLFCDSIELAGANWTDDLEGEFRRRRGYSLESYLPFIHMEQQSIHPDLMDIVRRARYDFSLTLAELFMERFILNYHEWCQENNTLSRYQAYGHPWLYTDMIDGFMVPDIPEGDQWLFNPGWSLAKINEIRYAIWNKYASSGGHLGGRKIVSSEAMTNTSGVFRASLEYIKQATDLNFIAGINHLVLHGFNYSPPEAGFPGWVRYGCYFNEQNPWWQYFPLWSEYTSRISAVLQNSTPVSQWAILGPKADVWSDHGLDRNPFNMTPWYLHSIWQALNHNGICSDYINERIIRNAEVHEGKLRYGSMSYEGIILCDVHTIDPDTLERLSDFQSNGMKLIFIGKIPALSSGLVQARKRDLKVHDTMEKILSLGAYTIGPPDQDQTDPYQGLTNWTQKLIKQTGIRTGISINPNDSALFYIQKKFRDTDIFFFSNSDPSRTLNLDIDLRIPGKQIWKWCPETLDRTLAQQNSMNIFHLVLSPLESALLILENTAEEGTEGSDPVTPVRTHALEGNWTVSGIHKIDASEFKRKISKLQDLSRDEELKGFTGEIMYSLDFEITETDYSLIDPGVVFDIADIYINGMPVGIRWWGKKPLSIAKGILKKGSNTLVIKVYNRLFNYAATLSGNPVARHWIERNRHQTSLPTGLLGPVVLS